MAMNSTEKNDEDILVLHDTPIHLGETRVVRIQVAGLPTGTIIDLPVHVLRGERPGPTLLLQGGLHGDEINGIEILRRMMEKDLCCPDAGTVLVIPVLNVFGFLQYSREAPGGKDVNRSFPGSKRGSLASRVAWHHTHLLLPHTTFAIDLHTGGGRRHNHPQIRYTPDDPASQELAKAFAAPFCFPSKLIPKSFRHTAHKHGVPAVVYEGGESMRIDEACVEQGILGVRRVMHHLDMLDDGVTTADAVHLDRATWVRARSSGLHRAFVRTGDMVDKGDVVGTITDPFDTFRADVKAPCAGYVITVNHQAVVSQGDALLRIGIPTDGSVTTA
jgi:predicted deacylase